MNVNVLIDAVVRQTTILIAQLATSGGGRAPLAHTANQVFLDLVTELKQQGVGSKVIADMFGMALRTYHDRVRRLSESRTVRGRSLWEAVLEHLEAQGTALQAEVLTRFASDDEALVRSVLADLVESGMVYRSGRGASVSYRAASADEVSLMKASDHTGAAASLVWVAVSRAGPATREQIAELVPLDPAALGVCLEQLTADGRVSVEPTDPPRYSAARCVIPLGDAVGWEAAIFDHYQAMVTAICTKLRLGERSSSRTDAIGGSTYGFTVWPGHPLHGEVLGFLGAMREQAMDLRRRVREHNDACEVPDEGTVQVVAYVGQTVIEAEEHSE